MATPDSTRTRTQYSYMGTGTQRAQMREAGLFIQDSWRWKPSFTINLGLRYELQFPFYPLNSSYSTGTLADVCGVSGVGSGDSIATQCNIFQPGSLGGKKPQFVNFAKGTYAYDTDYNNFAPNVGFAWTLNDKGVCSATSSDRRPFCAAAIRGRTAGMA